jgi:hypothetical protein
MPGIFYAHFREMIMSDKKKAPQPTQNIAFTSCTFTDAGTNEHDADVTVALADAVKELAIALQKIADAAHRPRLAPMVNVGR